MFYIDRAAVHPRLSLVRRFGPRLVQLAISRPESQGPWRLIFFERGGIYIMHIVRGLGCGGREGGGPRPSALKVRSPPRACAPADGQATPRHHLGHGGARLSRGWDLSLVARGSWHLRAPALLTRRTRWSCRSSAGQSGDYGCGGRANATSGSAKTLRTCGGCCSSCACGWTRLRAAPGRFRCGPACHH